MDLRHPHLKALPRIIFALGVVHGLPACSNVPLSPGATLTSDAGMTEADGFLTKARVRVDSARLAGARTVRIVPTDTRLSGADLDPADLALVANTIDRGLCSRLGETFEVVGPDEPADLVVRATVTRLVPTNRIGAATSTVASLGATVMLPVPVPRLPVGLGGLSVEAEAVAADGTLPAAMAWSRGANIVTTQSRVSEVGDAYALSSAFANDFSRMLVTGKSPFGGGLPSLPSRQRIGAALGATPADACASYGRSPGIPGAIAGRLGMPPGWADGGASTPTKAAIAPARTRLPADFSN